jgi:hypothetical protein
MEGAACSRSITELFLVSAINYRICESCVFRLSLLLRRARSCRINRLMRQWSSPPQSTGQLDSGGCGVVRET